MREITKKKAAAVLCAAVMALLFAVTLAVLLLPALQLRAGEWVALGLGAACILAMIAGVIAAASQRLRELRSGEEEEAKKY